jgi:hypothetical protein
MIGKQHTFVYGGLPLDTEHLDRSSRASNPITGLKLKISISRSTVAL